MRLTCPNCGAIYAMDTDALPPGGSHVQCGACHTRWFAKAQAPAPERLSEDQIIARLEGRARPRLAGGTEAGPQPETSAAATPIAFPGPSRPAPVAAPAPPPREAAPPPDAGRAPPPALGPGPTPLRPRQTGERAAPAVAPGPERPAQAPRFLLGFLAALALVGAALAGYVRAEALAARVPAAEPAATAYVAAVDDARAWIEARLGPLRDRLAGG